jgi:molecular chaperone GrpE
MVEKDDKKKEEIVREDEVLPEEVEIEAETEEELMEKKLRSLREKLAQCEEEKRKHHEDLQRAKADFLNSKRRLEEQFARDKERATDKILAELLTLSDSFDTAMADRELWNKIEPKWRTGIEAIRAKLNSILKDNSITVLDPQGERFNPEEHEAVSSIVVDDNSKADMIVSVLQKGYKRNETIIRPARVVVGTK